MPHFLFVATPPVFRAGEPSEPQNSQWRRFLNDSASIETTALPGQRLADNVWLLPLHGGLSTLAALVQAATKTCSYKVLFIEGEWVDTTTSG